ncbi:glycosyltransferase family protein [Prosthecobacter sp.]
MRILALTFGDLNCASTYYRLGQHLGRLKEDGIECTLLTSPSAPLPSPKKLSGYDVLLVQKRLFSCRTVNYLRRHAKRLVYDTDDATWQPQQRKHNWLTRWRTNRRLKAVVRAADLCVVANNYLGDHLRSLGGKTHLIPMSLNEKEWQEPTLGATATQVRIGWAGAPANLRYLEDLEPLLHEVLRLHSTAQIAIFCGERPSFKNGLPYSYLPWQKGGEQEAISTFHLGLLPLPTDAFSQGKSPIKALQYMAVGIPVVGTPAAGALEIGNSQNGVHFAHSDEQWLQLLGNLIENHEFRCSQGLAARQLFESNYTASRVYKKWIKLVTQS